MLGMDRAMKGGIGTASISLSDGLTVGAIVAVNAIGGVYEAATGRIVAGPRSEDGESFLDALQVAISPQVSVRQPVSASNTTIGVVATNAALNKEQANKLASAAQDGVALAVRPAHLMSDGDTMFALATGKSDSAFNMNQLLAAAVICVSDAIVNAVNEADSLGGVPSVKDLINHVLASTSHRKLVSSARAGSAAHSRSPCPTPATRSSQSQAERPPQPRHLPRALTAAPPTLISRMLLTTAICCSYQHPTTPSHR